VSISYHTISTWHITKPDRAFHLPFTISSNAIYALNAALNNNDWQTRFTNAKQWSTDLRIELREIGLSILADEQCRAPHVTTVVLPANISSLDIGEQLEGEGILSSYRSEYLIKKNRLQICFMGQCQKPPRSICYFLRKALSHTGSQDTPMSVGAV
jgi:aspartate aminotransferase-like enzyme